MERTALAPSPLAAALAWLAQGGVLLAVVLGAPALPGRPLLLLALVALLAVGRRWRRRPLPAMPDRLLRVLPFAWAMTVGGGLLGLPLALLALLTAAAAAGAWQWRRRVLATGGGDALDHALLVAPATLLPVLALLARSHDLYAAGDARTWLRLVGLFYAGVLSAEAAWPTADAPPAAPATAGFACGDAGDGVAAAADD